MKGPGIKDYLKEIEKRKEEKRKQGEKYIDITSKYLHEDISPNHATMPTCCQAMYKVMMSGDEILETPKGNTGFGSHLTVRFYVEDMENKDRMFPDKKEEDHVKVKKKNY